MKFEIGDKVKFRHQLYESSLREKSQKEIVRKDKEGYIFIINHIIPDEKYVRFKNYDMNISDVLIRHATPVEIAKARMKDAT